MAIFSTFSRVSAVALMTAVAGCSSLPVAGPSGGSITGGAAVTAASSAVGVDYVLVDLNKSMLDYFGINAPVPAADKKGSLVSFGAKGSPNVPLGPGDTIQITIFESQDGGLFIPKEAGSRPGNFVNLPNQTVGHDGTVNVPYAGAVPVAGRTASDVEREIVKRLAGRAIEPQAVVTVINTQSSQVAVVGDVNAPKKITLTAAGERVLDAVADAGGLSASGAETTVTVAHRNGQRASALYNDIVRDPKENIFVSPGDTITVSRSRRTFLAFGASTQSGTFNFADIDLTLTDGLGLVGGLLDATADPAQLFVYRSVDRGTLVKAGVDTTKFSNARTVPVVFHVNLRDPSAYFAASQFPLRDKDVLYVGNAASVELTKFLTILNSVSSTASGVPSDAVTARTSVRSLVRGGAGN